jgi:predicted HicB family RNase H-like nuclease
MECASVEPCDNQSTIVQRAVDIFGHEPVGSTSNCKPEATLVLGLHRKYPPHHLLGRRASRAQKLLGAEPLGPNVKRLMTRITLVVTTSASRYLHAAKSIIEQLVALIKPDLPPCAPNR